MKNGKFEAADIYNLLQKRHESAREWICAREVSNGTGMSACRRLDFVACNCFESTGQRVDAFEVKISKSDLRRELEDPEKHNIFFDDIDTYTIVAPDYVLDAEYVKLIPAKWGILKAVISAEGKMDDGSTVYETKLVTYRKPLALHDNAGRTLRRTFAMSLIRALATQDSKCHQKDELQREYEKGYQQGVEYAGRLRTDYKRLYEEQHWCRRVCSDLHIYSEDVYKAKANTFAAAIALAGDVSWFESSVDHVIKLAGELKKARAELAKKVEQAAKEIANAQPSTPWEAPETPVQQG